MALDLCSTCLELCTVDRERHRVQMAVAVARGHKISCEDQEAPCTAGNRVRVVVVRVVVVRAGVRVDYVNYQPKTVERR